VFSENDHLNFSLTIAVISYGALAQRKPPDTFYPFWENSFFIDFKGFFST